MTEKKWKIVGGSIYRLSEVFDQMLEAMTHAKKVKEKHLVFLSKTKNGRWAVYWRSKEPTNLNTNQNATMYDSSIGV